MSKRAKPVHHRTGEIYGQIDLRRTVGSNVSPKCLTYIIVESSDSRNKPKSEKPLCLVMVSVRLGIARHHLPYPLHKIQGRQRKHSSPVTTQYLSSIKPSIRVVPTVAWSACTSETCTCFLLYCLFWAYSGFPTGRLTLQVPFRITVCLHMMKRSCSSGNAISTHEFQSLYLWGKLLLTFFKSWGDVQHFQPPGTFL